MRNRVQTNLCLTLQSASSIWNLWRWRAFSGQALLKLGAKLLCLLGGELQLTVEDEVQLASAGIQELDSLEGGGSQRGGRECGLEICALLQGGE